MDDTGVVGWDVGGAHVKAALLQQGGALVDVVQWPCPLWQGTDQLERVLALARERWPGLDRAAHAVTMTGEMVDLFVDREDGVQRIAGQLSRHLGAPRLFAGPGEWVAAADAGMRWADIASANWLATASHVAQVFADRTGVLVDVGSTTTDLIAFGGGKVLTQSRTDAQRLSKYELVYQGVVRTPLMALARRIAWRGVEHNVMNELFATTADVYRLTGELDPAHDQQASADQAPKDEPHTCARLARMIGLDARDGSRSEWHTLAHAWRTAQVAELRGQLEQLQSIHGLDAGALAVAAGCGAFLVPAVLAPGQRWVDYGRAVARMSNAEGAAAETRRDWARVAAPAVAVAALYQMEQG